MNEDLIASHTCRVGLFIGLLPVSRLKDKSLSLKGVTDNN